MIIEPQDCILAGKSLYVKHPIYRADVSKAVRLSDNQLLAIREYLVACFTDDVRPRDECILHLLNDAGLGVEFA